MKKILSILIVAGMLMSLLSGCSLDSPSKPSDSASVGVQTENTSTENVATEEKVFRLGVNGGGSSGLLMEIAGLAYKNGYLEEELNNIGYRLEVTAMFGGPVINEALASGKLDAAIYGDFPAFTSKSNGIDTTVIANLNSAFQSGVLVVNDEIKEPKDLEGKRVIVQLGTSLQYFWEKYAKYYGIDTDKVEVINVSIDANALLTSGQADAYISSVYGVKYMESLGVGTVMGDGSEVTDGASTFVFEISTELLNEEPQVGIAVNKALIRAYNDAVSDPQKLYEAVSSEYMTPEIMAYQYAFDTSLSYMYPEITDELITYYASLNEWLYDHSYITEKVDINSYFDNSYFEKAAEELGR